MRTVKPYKSGKKIFEIFWGGDTADCAGPLGLMGRGSPNQRTQFESQLGRYGCSVMHAFKNH